MSGSIFGPSEFAIDQRRLRPQTEPVRLGFRLWLAPILAAMCVAPLSADAVRLTGGQVIEGRIVEESESTIVIRTRNGDFVIPRKDILEIENKGGDRIVRLDRPTIDPTKAALYSLIPFYSGLYMGDEPALGVPFAIAGGVYGMKLLNTLVRRTAFTEWHSDSGRQALYTLAMASVASRSASDSSYRADTDPDRFILIGYDLLRLYPVQGYRVGGRFYEKDELADFRRRTLQRFVLTSALGAGIAYSYFRFLGDRGLGGLFSHAGGRPGFVAWYALPTGEREWMAGAVFSF